MLRQLWKRLQLSVEPASTSDTVTGGADGAESSSNVFATPLAPAGDWTRVAEALEAACASDCQTDDHPTDERFRAIIVPLLLPAIRAAVAVNQSRTIDAKAKDKAKQTTASSSRTGRLDLELDSLGVGWCCVGLARLALLAPAQPVDPAVRPAVKRAVLLEEATATSAWATALRCEERLIRATDDSADGAAAAASAAVCERRAAMLAQRAAARPAGARPFGELRQVVARFGGAGGLADPPSVAQLARALLQHGRDAVGSADALKQSDDGCDDISEGFGFCHIALDSSSSGSSPQGVFAAERSWQRGAAAFERSLLRDFGGAYADIVEPIVSASAQLRLGLRFLAHAAHAAQSRSNASSGSESAASTEARRRKQGLSQQISRLLAFPLIASPAPAGDALRPAVRASGTTSTVPVAAPQATSAAMLLAEIARVEVDIAAGGATAVLSLHESQQRQGGAVPSSSSALARLREAMRQLVAARRLADDRGAYLLEHMDRYLNSKSQTNPQPTLA